MNSVAMLQKRLKSRNERRSWCDNAGLFTKDSTVDAVIYPISTSNMDLADAVVCQAFLMDPRRLY